MVFSMQTPNSPNKKAKLQLETTPISLWPLCFPLPPTESGWVGWPLRVSVCFSPTVLSSLGWSCTLKPELKSCVVIPAGETALALNGALSRREAMVTIGPSACIILMQCFRYWLAQHYLLTHRCQFFWGTGLATIFREMFEKKFWWVIFSITSGSGS